LLAHDSIAPPDGALLQGLKAAISHWDDAMQLSLHTTQLIIRKDKKEKKRLRLSASIQREAKYYTGLPR